MRQLSDQICVATHHLSMSVHDIFKGQQEYAKLTLPRSFHIALTLRFQRHMWSADTKQLLQLLCTRRLTSQLQTQQTHANTQL